jgi:hypothetical protein
MHLHTSFHIKSWSLLDIVFDCRARGNPGLDINELTVCLDKFQTDGAAIYSPDYNLSKLITVSYLRKKSYHSSLYLCSVQPFENKNAEADQALPYPASNPLA